MSYYTVAVIGGTGEITGVSTPFYVNEWGWFTTISWNATAGASGYRIFRRYSAGAPGDWEEYADYPSSTLGDEYYPAQDEVSLGWNTVTEQPPTGTTNLKVDRIRLSTSTTTEFLQDIHVFSGYSIYIGTAKFYNIGAGLATNGSWTVGSFISAGGYISGTTYLKIGSVSATLGTGDGAFSGKLQCGYGSTNSYNKTLYANGEIYGTKLNVRGYPSETPTANWVNAQGMVLDDWTSINPYPTSSSYDHGKAQLAVASESIMIASTGWGNYSGLYLFQTDYDWGYGASRIWCQKYSGVSYINSLNLETISDVSSELQVTYIRALRADDSGTRTSVARFVRSVSPKTTKYVQLVTDDSACYRWDDHGTDPLSPVGTTESFIINCSGGMALPASYASWNNSGTQIIPPLSTAGYITLPLKLPMGGIITEVVVTATVNTAYASPGYWRLWRRSATGTGYGTLVAGPFYYVAGTPSTQSLSSGALSHTVVADNTYYLELVTTSGSGAQSNITWWQAKVTETLDRHYPKWMG